jgi:hypothetical protein
LQCAMWCGHDMSKHLEIVIVVLLVIIAVAIIGRLAHSACVYTHADNPQQCMFWNEETIQ